MKIFRATRSPYITQWFGENKACRNANGKVVGTSDGVCPIGYRPFYKSIGYEGHNGLDIATWLGEPTYHCAEWNGWMRTEEDFDGGIGIDVVSHEPLLQCTEKGCKEKHYVKMRYWHNLMNYWHNHKIPTFKRVKRYKDIEVRSGEMVALSDSTGNSSGSHVHKGFKWCDKEGNGIHKDNGYGGAININKYYEDRFILDVLRIKELALTSIQRTRKLIFDVQMFINRFKNK